MNVRIVFALALVGLLAGYRPAWAITPWNATIDASEDMEHDSDTYTPSNTNPLIDPPTGNPPGDFTLNQEDWLDVRTGGFGVIEEVASGAASVGGVVAPIGSYNGHVASPHSAGNLAIVQFDLTAKDGPLGRSNSQVANPLSSAPFAGNRTGYWATMDLWIDPNIPYGGADGMADFVWTNAVNNKNTGLILSAAGMTGTVNPNGTWDIHTTGGVLLIGSIPAGNWIGLEVEPLRRASDNGLDFEYRVWADAGSHGLILIAFATLPAAGTVSGDFANLGGPRYNWYTDPGSNMSHLLVDNDCWTAVVPEPSTGTLLGMGAIGMIFAYRRRRRTP